MRKRMGTVATGLVMTMLLSSCGIFSASPLGTAAPKDGAPYLYEEPAYNYTTDMEAGLAYADAFEEGGYEMPMDEGERDDFNTDEFANVRENPFVTVEANPFSTFGMDVDTASYTYLRRSITEGLPMYKSSIRIEEMVNYFDYDYAAPGEGEKFSCDVELADCPWNEETKLLRIGVNTEGARSTAGSNLVFLIDVSGSMDSADKLGLLKDAFRILTKNLDESDTVSIVTYANGEDLVLEGASAEDKQEILDAIDSLSAHGSTNGERGMAMAYEVAKKYFIRGGNNRVIMATDGDLNVGISSTSELVDFVEKKKDENIFLSILGFGEGNYKDSKMESIADAGNGNYHYIDSILEADRVLNEKLKSTIYTVAKDAKIQVEFNPLQVEAYRQIGYENRRLNAEDFDDDSKDGGEVGANQSVTALYEVVLAGSGFEVNKVKSRYADVASADADGEEPADTDAEGPADDAEEASAEDAEETADAAEEASAEDADGTAADAEGDADADTKENADIADELLVVNVRYKEPEAKESKRLEFPVTRDAYHEEMSDATSWAAGVAQVGMLVRDSEHKGTSTYEEVRERLKPLADDDYKEEFLYLVNKLSRLDRADIIDDL